MKVHINQLPLKRNYVILKEQFHDDIFSKLLSISGTVANASRITGISKSALKRFVRKENKKIRLDFLLRIMESTKIPLDQIERKVIWIGNNNSLGVNKPRLPFKFDSRASARFIAAICNDGCITNGYRAGRRFSYGRVMYNNNEDSLRDSVVKDAEKIFGSKISKEFRNRGAFFIAFNSIVRDVLDIITSFKGEKSVNNPLIPGFIFDDKELMLGWIEQTIADEGQVKYQPEEYRREIIWRRSFNKNLCEFKLNIDECRMLDNLGIGYDVKNIGSYPTKKGIEKVRMQIRISRKDNLLNLVNIIKIPDKKKQKIFEEIIASISP